MIARVRGSGNIYRDLSIPDADVRQLKAILAAEIIKTSTKKDCASGRQRMSNTATLNGEHQDKCDMGLFSCGPQSRSSGPANTLLDGVYLTPTDTNHSLALPA